MSPSFCLLWNIPKKSINVKIPRCSLPRKRSRVVRWWDFISWKGSHTKYFNYCSQVADAAILGMCRRRDGYFRSLYGHILQRAAFLTSRCEHRKFDCNFVRINSIYTAITSRIYVLQSDYIVWISHCNLARFRLENQMPSTSANNCASRRYKATCDVHVRVGKIKIPRNFVSPIESESYIIFVAYGDILLRPCKTFVTVGSI